MYNKHVWIQASIWNTAVKYLDVNEKIYFVIFLMNFLFLKKFSNLKFSNYATIIFPKLANIFLVIRILEIIYI